jgi:uncharacterized membrane protein YfcA
LLAIWRSQGSATPANVSTDRKGFPFLAKVSLGGLSLGGIVTLTGMGGGVVLIPFLQGLLGLNSTVATATSLFTIFLTSISSIAFQFDQLAPIVDLERISFLIVGCLVSTAIVGFAVKRIEIEKLVRIRKGIITLVILYSMIVVSMKTWG